jgi:hypothetical protein
VRGSAAALRARSLKPGFFHNEDLIELPFEYRLLFAGLWTVADREGRLEDRPKKIKLNVFPGDNVDVDAGLQALHDRGFILRYTHGSTRYIQILAWKKHQHPHVKEGASTIPAPDEHSASTVQALDEPLPRRLPARLTASSLTPDSGLLTPDSSSLRSHSSAAPPRAAVKQVFEHWQTVWRHPDANLDAKRSKRIEARLKSFTPEQLCDSISGFRHSPWHCGTDPKGNGTVYDGIETLLRDDAQVEKGLGLFAHPPRPPPKPETAMERILRANSPDNSRVIDHDPAPPRALTG